MYTYLAIKSDFMFHILKFLSLRTRKFYNYRTYKKQINLSTSENYIFVKKYDSEKDPKILELEFECLCNDLMKDDKYNVLSTSGSKTGDLYIYNRSFQSDSDISIKMDVVIQPRQTKQLSLHKSLINLFNMEYDIKKDILDISRHNKCNNYTLEFNFIKEYSSYSRRYEYTKYLDMSKYPYNIIGRGNKHKKHNIILNMTDILNSNLSFVLLNSLFIVNSNDDIKFNTIEKMANFQNYIKSVKFIDNLECVRDHYKVTKYLDYIDENFK